MIAERQDKIEDTPLDRRLFERFPSSLSARLKEEVRGPSANVYLCDASALGVKITTEKRLNPKEDVILEVDLPDSKSPLTLQGQVVWMRPRETHLWEVGLKFHKVHLMQTARLYRMTTTSVP